MIPRRSICSSLSCVVVVAAFEGLEFFNPPHGGKIATYVWLGALGVAGVLLLMAWLRREHAQQRWMATAFWLFVLVASFLA